MSAPVLASFRLGSPVDHVPLGVTESIEMWDWDVVGTPPPPQTTDKWEKEIVRKKESLVQ